MIPARFDFPCRTNADYAEEFSVTDGSNPVDLTGYSATMVARFTPGGAAIFTLATVMSDIQGIRFIEPSQGIFVVRISDETLLSAYNTVVTNAQNGTAMNLIYDIKFTDPTGFEDVWYYGYVIIEKGITP